MTALYNEIDPFAVQWLRNLSDAGHIATGRVEPRSIVDLQPADLDGVTQFHTFAGIGVWSYALRLAGWPDGAPVWTGSCPCQPFSAAGGGGGLDDERHLWPEWFRLIRQCRPAIIFGEQVASPDGLRWLDVVSADLEGEGYAFGAADLCAAGVGAPHIRQRLFWVAHADGTRLDGLQAARLHADRQLRDDADGRGAYPPPRGDADAWRDAARRNAPEPGVRGVAPWPADVVGRLRAYGNAIVAEVAATFIRASVEAQP